MRILVCIASYGLRNDQYLHQLIDQYATMPHAVHVVVVSNIQKELPKGVELKVGLPIRNPWSLPFAHRPIFTERKDDYDLFIYSEDDTLITDRHIRAFMEAMKVLREDEVPGFLRSEEGPDGALYYSTIHRHFHWDPESVVRRGEDTFAFFSNEHGACYILTREQLRRAIASGGFSVPPHAGKYDMLVSAATDPYTQCGFKKMVCISRLEDFTCKHLTNKYLGRMGLEKALVDIQINALLDIGCGARPMAQPTRVETRLPGTRWTKSYYEPRRDDLVGLIPAGATRILSLGCGWGKTEEALIARGADVTAIPLDVVIGAVAASKGIRTVPTTLAEGPQQFVAGSFDAILIAGLLHLIDDPVNLLRAYGVSLAPDGVLVVSCPNVAHLAVRIKRFSGDPELKALGDYRHSGVHFTSAGLIRNWLAAAGFAVQHAQAKFAERWKNYNRLTLSLLEGLWAEEYAFVAKKCVTGALIRTGKDMARATASGTAKDARPLRACMLAYTFYENDGRVMRYAETLAQEGADVDAIVLRKDSQPVKEFVNGIKVLRIQKREKNETGKFKYLSRIVRFFFLSMVEVTRQHLRDPFDIIHVHSVPDFEVFAAWLPKLLGAKVILDIHDIVPEFYSAKFNVGHDSGVFAALKLVERMSAGFADHVIAANDLWLSKLTSRSVRSGKCSVFINYPDLSLFNPSLRTRVNDGKFILIYPGTLHWHQGLDIAIKAFAIAIREAPEMEFHIYGEGSAKPGLSKLVEELQLQDRVFLKAPMPIRQIATVMANADLGVVPKRNDSFGGEAFSTKILEFMALRRPIVAAATRIDKHYFDDALLRFFDAGNERDLALKMLDAYRDRALSERLADNALEFAKRVSWANKRGEYIDLVTTLVGGRK